MSVLGAALEGYRDLRAVAPEPEVALEQRGSLSPWDPDLPAGSGWSGGGWTSGMGSWHGGSTTSPDQAMRLTAVFACLRILSESIATLPIEYFKEDPSTGDREPYRTPPKFLTFPSPGLTKIDYFSQIMLSLLTDGNAYVLTPRDSTGAIMALIVLEPSRMEVSRKDGLAAYKYNGAPLTAHDVMHIKGMCMPGSLIGLSPIAYAAETVGVGLNAQRYGSSFFSNGALVSAVIKAPGKFSDLAAERWRDTWNSGHQGVGNANKIGVLTEGATIEKVSITNDEAQFLQTRQFTVPDVARVYGVPPHLIADASNSTSWGTGLAEQNDAFGQFSLRAWCERLEEGHDRLLTLDGLPDVCMELDMDAVMRATFKERMEGYVLAMDAEVMVPNEARQRERLKKVPWGDLPAATRRTESYTTPAAKPGPVPEPTTKPPTPAAPTPAGV